MPSGCELLINLTSAGRIAAPLGVTAFTVIEQALRDEGTSYHYLPPCRSAYLRPTLRERLATASDPGRPANPSRQHVDDRCAIPRNGDAHKRHREAGVLAVEMEAAALYALASARSYNVPCLAHLTKELGGEGRLREGPPTEPKTRCASSTQSCGDWTRYRAKARR
jgi:uridine phosphorylase